MEFILGRPENHGDFYNQSKSRLVRHQVRCANQTHTQLKSACCVAYSLRDADLELLYIYIMFFLVFLIYILHKQPIFTQRFRWVEIGVLVLQLRLLYMKMELKLKGSGVFLQRGSCVLKC